MGLTEFSNLFRKDIAGKLETGLKSGDNNAEERLFSDCYELLRGAVFTGDIRPISDSEEMRICQFLSKAGYLKQNGSKESFFELTDRAYELISYSN